MYVRADGRTDARTRVFVMATMYVLCYSRAVRIHTRTDPHARTTQSIDRRTPNPNTGPIHHHHHHHHRGQIPLIYITDHLEKTLFRETQAGNFAFWLIFCVLGQPMAVRRLYVMCVCLFWEGFGVGVVCYVCVWVLCVSSSACSASPWRCGVFMLCVCVCFGRGLGWVSSG